VIASYLQSGSHEWHPSGRPRRTYNLLISKCSMLIGLVHQDYVPCIKTWRAFGAPSHFLILEKKKV